MRLCLICVQYEMTSELVPLVSSDTWRLTHVCTEAEGGSLWSLTPQGTGVPLASGHRNCLCHCFLDLCIMRPSPRCTVHFNMYLIVHAGYRMPNCPRQFFFFSVYVCTKAILWIYKINLACGNGGRRETGRERHTFRYALLNLSLIFLSLWRPINVTSAFSDAPDFEVIDGAQQFLAFAFISVLSVLRGTSHCIGWTGSF